jgi:hypothetical protein
MRVFIAVIKNVRTNFSLKICSLLVEEGFHFARLALRVFSSLGIVSALDDGISSAFVLSSWWYFSQSVSQSYITTDGQSASLSWYQAPMWGL